ncbi:MAG: SDR family NAD(P)-dependent oxidoreductase [Acidimicrobiia bacterium]
MASTGRFEGKTAVVTGGVGGIGSAITARFVAEGATVIATGYSADEIAARGDDEQLTGAALRVLRVDDDADVVAFASAFDRLDILVNCAGTTATGPSAFDEDKFVTVLDVNVSGTMRCCRAFKDKLSNGGAIVNIASMMTFLGSATAPGYAASKGAVGQLTKSLAIAWAPAGIRVNAIAPGWIETPMSKAAVGDDYRKRVQARTPLDRWGLPDDIAGPAAFLCSDDARFVTGVILPVDGGYLAV